MRRTLAVLAMVAALLAAHLVNVWFAASLRAAQETFRMGELRWLYGLLLLFAAATGFGLGWLVLRAHRPDPLVGVVYAVVGLAVVFASPVWMSGGWTPPVWLPIRDLLAGQALAVWVAAAIATIGLAEVTRWIRLSPFT